jgi:replicative DNA helicase
MTMDIANDAAIKAEQHVIGSILIDPATLDVIRGTLTDSDFYAEYNREIFKEACRIHDEGGTVNIATIYSALINSRPFIDKGGIEILTRATEATATAGNVESYIRTVKKHSVMRSVALIGASVRDAAEGRVDVYDYLNGLKETIDRLTQERDKTPWIPFGDAVRDALQAATTRSTEGLVKTGYTDLDRMLTGFKPGTLSIIAARPAMGKTALGLNMMVHAAIKQNIPTTFFSLEMTAPELAMRVISCVESIPGKALQEGMLDDAEWERVFEFARKSKAVNISIDQTPALDIHELQRRMKTMKRRYNTGIAFVDYLQMMCSGRRGDYNRVQEVSDISRGLKEIAKELNIPVVAMAQLNRNIDTRPDKHPVMSDLRESGSIEQDADNIMFIYRNDYYHPNDTPTNEAEIIIAKQRSGPTGTVKLRWTGEFTRFDTLENRF